MFLQYFATYAQVPGVNYDPGMPSLGKMPYEMACRIEPRKPLITFDDCSKWIVNAKGCHARLFRTQKERIHGYYSGRLAYKSTAEAPEITVLLEDPVVIPDPWDCINFWNIGTRWIWEKEKGEAMHDYVLIKDATGKLRELPLVQAGYAGMIHKYWFLRHIKLTENIPRPAKFVGFRFKATKMTNTDSQNIYLGPVYFYKEEMRPLYFSEWPDTLPFPTRTETILPINKKSHFNNEVTRDGHIYTFNYSGEDTMLHYQVNVGTGFPLAVSLHTNTEHIKLFHDGEIWFEGQHRGTWELISERLSNDTLFIISKAAFGKKTAIFSFWYTIRQKSLICNMEEVGDSGCVDSVSLGATGIFTDARLFRVPFLNFHYLKAPKILYGDGLFYFTQFDWYYSNASRFTEGNQGFQNGYAVYNGGVQYIPKTNGVKNLLRERLFINVSPLVQEVLPTIPNPKSPMRSLQAHRLWKNEGHPAGPELKKRVRHLRALGLEQVSIRYHEGFWRDGGESYTFKLHTAPGRGGDSIVYKEMQFVKQQGWRVGLYTNYTDLAPVNKNWNEDWIMQGPKGEWNVSWSRCYAPKPMVAWQVEKENASVIHNTFGTNFSYCDVHTAVSPMTRVDYDYRVPGSATFRRTFECFGLLLLNEKKAYTGPVYSEGGTHWLYAGLVDGNFGRSAPSLDKQPIFPDFQLLKIHPLEMDAGIVESSGPQYLAYTLAYGHIGILKGREEEMLKRYYFLQSLQPYYSMVPVKSIAYESNGTFYNVSSALLKGINQSNRARLRLAYHSGLEVFINFNNETWTITCHGRRILLPKWGIYASTNNNGVMALSGMQEAVMTDERTDRIDVVHTSYQHYLDTYGKYVTLKQMAGKGKIALKKESFGWEIIPARKFFEFGFDPALLGFTKENIKIESIQENGHPGPTPEVRWSRGKLFLIRKDSSVFKYRVVPVSGSRPKLLSSDILTLRKSSTRNVQLRGLPSQKKLNIYWHLGQKLIKAEYCTNDDKVVVLSPGTFNQAKHVWLELRTMSNKSYWIDFFVSE